MPLHIAVCGLSPEKFPAPSVVKKRQTPKANGRTDPGNHAGNRLFATFFPPVFLFWEPGGTVQACRQGPGGSGCGDVSRILPAIRSPMVILLSGTRSGREFAVRTGPGIRFFDLFVAQPSPDRKTGINGFSGVWIRSFPAVYLFGTSVLPATTPPSCLLRGRAENDHPRLVAAQQPSSPAVS